MSSWAWIRQAGAAAAGVALMVGCVVQDGSGSSGGGYVGGGSSSGGSGSSSGGGTTVQPMLVDVDPNQTMNATPGAGVGVFVQYTTGGHWEIWWTCDTNVTQLSCGFQNTVSVASGTIANVATQGFLSSDTISQLTPQQVQATTTTTTGVSVLTFDTPFTAGQTPIITVNALLDGADNGSYLFFVQNGQINGNYKGQLTDPLQLEPSAP